MFSPKTRILVVDDMFTMRKIVMKSMKEMGFTDIQDASDGVVGWEKISTANPPIDLVISDWNMPRCTGLDLLKKVRADQKLARTPFILLTAESESHQVSDAMKAGASDYVIKPFTAGMLKEKIAATYKRLFPGA